LVAQNVKFPVFEVDQQEKALDAVVAFDAEILEL
jgi:hypothetical protein